MELPSQVKLVEVGPRDGLQNQPITVSIAQRVEFIERLARCGFTAIETGSLVSAQRIPQMANSEIVYQQIHQQPSAEYIMLVANQQGFASRPISIPECDLLHLDQMMDKPLSFRYG
jgi:hydroxymethylglutaryl-CoA lyase